MWEVGYAKFLDEKGIRWRRPKESFEYEFEGKKHRYTPDFYLTKTGVFVEIKGYETAKDRAKWTQFPGPLIVLKGEDLYRMGIVESYREVTK
jgi:hypothetical protein